MSKRVLVACECSGTIRNAFLRQGFDAWSADLQKSDNLFSMNHIQGDVTRILNDGWDLIIAHPPCTHLAVSGNKHFEYKADLQDEAINFVKLFLNAKCNHVAVENPVSIIASRIRKSDQVIHPYQYGGIETKSTCLWLKALPFLQPTNVSWLRAEICHRMPETANRSKLRSVTEYGIADAMAKQWGAFILKDNIPLFYSPKDLTIWNGSSIME